ncbi:MAG: PD40 domain-containing protein [Opitutaceae bacterium]|nr:PD40 domain-containing protein [Opitutaceae bacterium]
MKNPRTRPLRAISFLLLSGSLSIPLMTAFAADATPREAPAVTAGVVHERVAPASGQATEKGIFGTSPESPDGKSLIYISFDWKADPGQAFPAKGGYSKGALHVCGTDLKNHVKIRDLARARWHDGAMQIWLDNDTLAYMDFLPARNCYVTYVIRKNGDPVLGPLEGSLGHGDTPDGSVLLIVDGKKYPNGSSLGRRGLYLYKAGTVRQVVDLERDLGSLKSIYKDSDAPADWMIAHAELSPKGTHISIRLDPKKGMEKIVTCKADGSDVREFKSPAKPLHQQWYDDTTIFGHRRGGGPDQLKCQRWDRDGKLVETLAGPGNHIGMSPDRRYLVSENIYTSDPVVMKLYRTGNTEPLAVLMNVPQGPIWAKGTHVNPSFSHDGRYVYFNKPVDGMPQLFRIDLSRWIGR